MGLFGDLVRYVQLSRKSKVLQKKDDHLTSQLEEVTSTDPRWLLLVSERNLVQKELHAIDEEVEVRYRAAENAILEQSRKDEWRKQHPDLYSRPDSFMNKHLGVLPDGVKILKPTLKEMRKVESHQWMLVISIIITYLVMDFVDDNAPWLLKGLSSLVFGYKEEIQDPSQFAYVHVVSIICLVAIVVFRNPIDAFLYRRAIAQAQRFRMGSENWTWAQRGNSYIAGTIQSISALLFIPLIYIPFVCMPICMLSMVYLNTFKATSDVEHATLVSAKLNAQFIKYFTISIFLFALYPWIATLFVS